jgi:apolipoprotein N-acyltransferase
MENLLFFNIGPRLGIIGIISLVLMIYALLDVFKSNIPQNSKLLWVIIILVAPLIGSIIYLVWGKNQRL